MAVLVLWLGAASCEGVIGQYPGHTAEPEHAGLPAYRFAPPRATRTAVPFVEEVEMLQTGPYPSDIPADIANAWPNDNVSAFTKTIDWGFQKGQVEGPEMSANPGIFEVVPEDSAPFSAPWVLKSIRPAPLDGGEPRGGGIQMDHLPPNVNELYLGQRFLASPQFEGGGNRLWVVVSARLQIFIGWKKTPGAEFDDGTSGIGLVNNELDNCHIAESPQHCVLGSVNVLNNGPGAHQPLRRGRWNLIETYIKVSSSESARDGKLRLWLNGVLVTSYDNVSLSAQPLNQISYQQGWVDGFQGPQTREWFYLLDHMRIRY